MDKLPKQIRSKNELAVKLRIDFETFKMFDCREDQACEILEV